MRVTVDDDGVFRFAGGPDVVPAAHPVSGETAGVRSTLTLAAGGDLMTALWERSPGWAYLGAVDAHLVYETWLNASGGRALNPIKRKSATVHVPNAPSCRRPRYIP
jgi:hypothetical protein